MNARSIKFVLFTIVALLAAGEGYFRYIVHLLPGKVTENNLPDTLAKFIEFDPSTWIRYKPNVDTLIDAPSNDFSILYKTNEIGLRDHAMGTHLRSELKFLVFGDEFAEGWGTDIDETVAVRAQNLINAKTELRPPVRFVIAAKSGFGAAQNYLLAKQLMESISPKLVIFFYSSLMPHADAQFLANAAQGDGLVTGLNAGIAQSPRFPHLEDFPPTAQGLLAALAPYSALARFGAEYFSQRTHTANIKLGDPSSDRLAGIRAEAPAQAAVHAPSLKYVKAIADLAKSKDAPFLLIHVPLPPQVTTNEWMGGRQLFQLPPNVLPADDIPAIQKFCADNSLKCLNLLDVMQKAAAASNSEEMFHRNELGFNPNGTKIVGAWLGNMIFDWMGELGWRTPKS